MSDKKKITVTILDHDYSVVTDDEPNHVYQVARLVDENMRSTQRISSKMSLMQIAVLASMNIADEYIRIKKERDELRLRLENPQYDLKSTRDELNGLMKAFDDRNTMYSAMMDEIETLVNNVRSEELNRDIIKDRMEYLNLELQLRDDEKQLTDEEVKELDEKVKDEQSKKSNQAALENFMEKLEN